MGRTWVGPGPGQMEKLGVREESLRGTPAGRAKVGGGWSVELW